MCIVSPELRSLRPIWRPLIVRMSEVLYFLLRRVQAELVQRGALWNASVPHGTFERRNEAETLGAWPCGLRGRA